MTGANISFSTLGGARGRKEGLTPTFNASAIAHKSADTGSTLREAALALGDISAAEFDRVVDPETMVGSL